MANKAVIVFLKAPEKGRVKTRLSNSLDKGFVLELYKAFVKDTLDAVVPLGRPIVFFWPKNKKKAVTEWLGDDILSFPQQGVDLGQRMAHAFKTVFDAGYDRAVLIGTDIPQLNSDILTRAFENLESAPAVIGPSKDGGYYLIGFQKQTFSSRVFEGIDWSTPHVLEQTQAVMDTNNISFSRVETLNDIDTIADLKDLADELEDGCRVGRHTRAMLEKYRAGRC